MGGGQKAVTGGRSGRGHSPLPGAEFVRRAAAAPPSCLFCCCCLYFWCGFERSRCVRTRRGSSASFPEWLQEAHRAVRHGAWRRTRLSSREGAPRGCACVGRDAPAAGDALPRGCGATGRSHHGCCTPGRAACLQAAGRPERRVASGVGRAVEGRFGREPLRSAAPRSGRLEPLMLWAPVVTRSGEAPVADFALTRTSAVSDSSRCYVAVIVMRCAAIISFKSVN